MDSETRLVCTKTQAAQLINKLQVACHKIRETGEVQHVDIILEQSNAKGPWRLILHVFEEPGCVYV